MNNQTSILKEADTSILNDADASVLNDADLDMILAATLIGSSLARRRQPALAIFRANEQHPPQLAASFI